jgi:uncharacterized coiled-coil protein SlyX
MNKKSKALAAALTLTTAFGVGMALQAKFTDIPTNHWAEGAVNRMVAEGIVNGYPDGTFRGNNTVNRYEATSMFDRLIASKRFATIEQNAQAAAQVSSDISVLRSANIGNATAIAGLQADIAALKAAPSSSPTTTTPVAPDNTEINARIAGLEEKLAALTIADSAATDRLTALEASLKELQSNGTPTNETPTNPELDARLTALESSSANTAELSTQLEAQNARVTALENQVRSLNSTVASLQKTVGDLPNTPATSTPVTPSEPATTTPTDPASSSTTDAPSVPALYVSGGVSTNLIPSAPFNAPLGLGVFAAVGLNLSNDFSIRLSADLSEIPSAGVNLLFNLGGGLYAGVGGGLVFGGGGIYAGGIVGFGFEIAQNFSLFLEANPRFNFGSSGFGVKTALGLRLGL